MSDVRVIGVPIDYGANRRGVDMGPSAIRYAGVAEAIEEAGYTYTETGDLITAQSRYETADPEHTQAKYLPQIREVCEPLADRVATTIDDGGTPVVLGGDHSISIGSIAGSSRDGTIGVLWLDAHADFNTPATSPSGNVHGMSLAAALGQGAFGDKDWATAHGLEPEAVGIVGLRSVDESERTALKAGPIGAYPMSEIDIDGIATVVDRAVASLPSTIDGVHLSLDLDLLDPSVAPGVGTPVHGGITYREAHTAIERIADQTTVRSVDLVEVNPILDQHNKTAELAVELLASALGTRIL